MQMNERVWRELRGLSRLKKHHLLELFLSFLLLLLLILSLAVFAIAEYLNRIKCRLLQRPTRTNRYRGAYEVIMLKQTFGSLIAHQGTRENGPICLVVHSLRGNADDCFELVESLKDMYSKVFVLEPRGFGPDVSQASLASTMIAIRLSIEKIRELYEGSEVQVCALGLGASLARFVIAAFSLQVQCCLFLNPIAWDKMYETKPWLRDCKTLALTDWSKPPAQLYPFNIVRLE